jgi:hypothetical protein
MNDRSKPNLVNRGTKQKKSSESGSQHDVENRNQGIGFIQTLKSVLMGFIGIQSSKDHQRDFEKGKPSDFIIIGVVMTILFILTVYSIVSSALEEAGL